MGRPSCPGHAEDRGPDTKGRHADSDRKGVGEMAKTVLVVDDDPTQRRLLQAVLEKQGHHPEMAESGEAAIERVKRGGIDVVLLDLVMPGMDGMETLETLKAREPELPVIVLTAHGGIETVVLDFVVPRFGNVQRP